MHPIIFFSVPHRLRRIGALSALTFVLIAAGCSKDASAPSGPSANAGANMAADFDQTKREAEAGDAAAQNRLGERYLNGQGVRQDAKAAAEWFTKSAEHGHAPGQFNLGTLFEAGQGVPFDYTRAVEWYRKAAEQEHAAAQYSLAVMYTYARGVRRDDAEALKWLTRAAQRGDPMAAYAMGERCRNAIGVPLDLVEAYKWFALAAAQKVEDARTALDQIKVKMSRDQIAEGRKRAEAFVPQ
jgi:TPR repeat protein